MKQAFRDKGIGYLKYLPTRVSEEKFFCAIIGDIVRSKGLQDRNQVQTALVNTLNQINLRYDAHIVSRFLVTLGDEFQGLMKPTGKVIVLLDAITQFMESVDIRFGIGFGSIDTKLEEYALGMDGEAFHKARMAIDKAKVKSRNHYVVTFGDSLTPALELSINTIFHFVTQIKNSWTQKERRLYRLIALGFTQRDVSVLFNVSQSAISQNISRARIMHVVTAIDRLSLILDIADNAHTGLVKPLKDCKGARLSDYAIHAAEFREDYNTAQKFFEQSLSCRSLRHRPVVLANYATFLAKLKKDYEKAERFYENALNEQPRNVTIQTYYAITLALNNKPCDEAFKRAIELGENPEILDLYASFLGYVQGQCDKAKKYYEKAIRLVDSDSTSVLSYVRYLISMGNADEANKLYCSIFGGDYNRNSTAPV